MISASPSLMEVLEKFREEIKMETNEEIKNYKKQLAQLQKEKHQLQEEKHQLQKKKQQLQEEYEAELAKLKKLKNSYSLKN